LACIDTPSRLGQEFLRLDRPLTLIFHEVNVYDPIQDKHLGKIELDCSLCSRQFSVYNATGDKIFTLFSGCLECWTFHIQKNGENVGEIRKLWSGFLKEAFTVSNVASGTKYL